MRSVLAVVVILGVALAAAPALALHDPHDRTGRHGWEQGAVFGLEHSSLDAQGQQQREALVQPAKKNYRWSNQAPTLKVLEIEGQKGGQR